MPASFYSPNLAKRTRRCPFLSIKDQALLGDCLVEDLFGHIAPDVQTISSQPRQATYFFNVSLRLNAWAPWDKLPDRRLELIPACRYPHPHAAYLAGLQIAHRRLR